MGWSPPVLGGWNFLASRTWGNGSGSSQSQMAKVKQRSVFPITKGHQPLPWAVTTLCLVQSIRTGSLSPGVVIKIRFNRLITNISIREWWLPRMVRFHQHAQGCITPKSNIYIQFPKLGIVEDFDTSQWRISAERRCCSGKEWQSSGVLRAPGHCSCSR